MTDADPHADRHTDPHADPHPDPHADPHAVGSLGEEATRLLGALSGWAREHADEAGDGLTGLASHLAASAHDLDDHLATGSAECTVCPVCRMVAVVRQTSPEVSAHLGAAAASLAQAFSAVMATRGPRTPRREDDPDVEHIDLDDEWPEDP
ncbi:hypothetical protein [Nocardioides sp. zg-1228]|uniref:hypothetical protein n=1 Tax=Nocardioides sp. zg-1228 TaxID=2763008 RepID=UPI0016434774|nr:hypothetical protein [Nocardioides sp. zg-1228]MBC2933482.1 hypothetical protein [Nocardioides sp. zg-1228]QSF56378.1 hypothetical protein JX575_12010 [Nocardioides sp. zg-1228]